MRKLGILLLFLTASCGHSPQVATRAITALPSTTTTSSTVLIVAPSSTAVKKKASRSHVRHVQATPERVTSSVMDTDFWHRLGDCESGNNPLLVSKSGKYRGAFQFTLSTWKMAGETGDPITYDYAYQLTVTKRWASQSDPFQQWPVCWRRALR